MVLYLWLNSLSRAGIVQCPNLCQTFMEQRQTLKTKAFPPISSFDIA